MDYKELFLNYVSESPDFLDFIADAFLIVNKEGQILNCNENLLKLLDYSREKLLEIRLEDLEVENQILKNLDTIEANSSYCTESVFRTAQGQDKNFEITVVLFNQIEETLFLIFAHDITDYKRKENKLKKTYQENKNFIDELRKQKNRINTILQTSMDAFWIMDMEGYILETNESFRDMFGYSLMEIMNLNV
ncbi:MAG: PAS domain S-box protein, partial [Bacillota bacterium]